MRLERVRLVLVQPLFAGNVGACARVAANFDLRDLWLVSPQCDPGSPEARLYAKGPAASYLERFQRAESLNEALAGCASAVGFTRRSGELREASLEVAALAGEVRRVAEQGPVALVFGREDSGLTRGELLACTHVCSFDVADVMPSLNLSHAVAVAVARLYSEIGETGASAKGEKGEDDAASLAELEALFTHWGQAMADAGMTTAGNPDRMLAHFRRLFQRAELTSRDAALFRAYLSKTQVKMGTRKRTRG